MSVIKSNLHFGEACDASRVHGITMGISPHQRPHLQVRTDAWAALYQQFLWTSRLGTVTGWRLMWPGGDQDLACRATISSLTKELGAIPLLQRLVVG